MQRLLNNARWEARKVRDDLRGYVIEQRVMRAGC
jgi:hypothetical protein